MGARVFISYSHSDEAVKALIPSLEAALQRSAFDAQVDIGSPEVEASDPDWERWCREQITDAAMIICICTKDYRERFERRIGGATGRGVEYEGRILETSVYDRDVTLISKCVVLRPEGSGRNHVPQLLRHVPEFKWPQESASLLTSLRRGPLDAIRVAPPRKALFVLALGLAVTTMLGTMAIRAANTNAQERQLAADALAWDLVHSIPYPGADEEQLERQGKLCQERSTNRGDFLQCEPWKRQPRWPTMPEHVLRGLARIDAEIEENGNHGDDVRIFQADFGPTDLPIGDYRLVYLEGRQPMTARKAAIDRVRGLPGRASLRQYYDLLLGDASSAMYPLRWAELQEMLRSSGAKPEVLMGSASFDEFVKRAAVARLKVGDLDAPAVRLVTVMVYVLLLAAMVVLALAIFGFVQSRRIVPVLSRQHLLPAVATLLVIGTVPLALSLWRRAVGGLRWPLPGEEVHSLAVAQGLTAIAAVAASVAAIVATLSLGRDRIRSAGHP